jgi:hypothetical protein
MVEYMNIFNEIRNFIDDKSFKLILYNNLIDIINFKEIIDIKDDLIKILSDKEITIKGKDLCVIKLLDNEILIRGNIESINV